MTVSVGPRQLVRDNYDRVCIVVESSSRPSKSWLLAQDHPIPEDRLDDPWWVLLPLGGGAVTAPSGLLTVLREATQEDAMQVVSLGNVATARRVLQVFPELRDLVVPSGGR